MSQRASPCRPGESNRARDSVRNDLERDAVSGVPLNRRWFGAASESPRWPREGFDPVRVSRPRRRAELAPLQLPALAPPSMPDASAAPAHGKTLLPAIFLDKDGTLLRDVPFNVNPALMELAPGAPEALRILGGLGAPLFIISNQAGVALGLFSFASLGGVEQRLRALCAAHGAALAACYFCLHHPQGAVPQFSRSCTCRKPAPGMLVRAAYEHGLDLASSWFAGDILDDVQAGKAAGCRTVLIDNGNETEWRLSPEREPDRIVGNLHQAAAIIAQDFSANGPAPTGKSGTHASVTRFDLAPAEGAARGAIDQPHKREPHDT